MAAGGTIGDLELSSIVGFNGKFNVNTALGPIHNDGH